MNLLFVIVAWLAGAMLVVAGPAAAQKKYDTGASDAEIKIGQTMPYSGNASSYGTIGRAEVAYFQMINEQGGINGRKINLVSLDDGYTPPRTVEQIRRLVEQEQVLFIFRVWAPRNTAIQKYLNARKSSVVRSHGATVGHPKNYPWTIGGS